MILLSASPVVYLKTLMPPQPPRCLLKFAIGEARYQELEWALDSQIRETAYYKWEQAGSPPDMADQFWFDAEREVCDIYLYREVLQA